ncbi:uncharacterized protein LOC143185884 [Calliopsis andreniformis]|uniref:uncharacterized protein LOC143185884 n=1 Tax=Calliopsis andreniformis TaxID=337506 RepID=UPI003FCCDC35
MMLRFIVASRCPLPPLSPLSPMYGTTTVSGAPIQGHSIRRTADVVPAHAASNGPVVRQSSWFPPGTRVPLALGHCSPSFESNIVTARDTCPGHNHDEAEQNLAVREPTDQLHIVVFKNQLDALFGPLATSHLRFDTLATYVDCFTLRSAHAKYFFLVYSILI